MNAIFHCLPLFNHHVLSKILFPTITKITFAMDSYQSHELKRNTVPTLTGIDVFYLVHRHSNLLASSTEQKRNINYIGLNGVPIIADESYSIRYVGRLLISFLYLQIDMLVEFQLRMPFSYSNNLYLMSPWASNKSKHS